MRVFAIIALVIVVFVGMSSFFTVSEKEKAVLFKFGQIVRSDYEPGIHFKMPFVNNVRKFEDRILTLDTQPDAYLTAEKKNVIVDSFIQWRITDVEKYYTSMRGNEGNAQVRISQVVKESLRAEFGKRTIKEVVSGERTGIMDVVNVSTNQVVDGFGIEVVDVRIKRIDLPTQVSDAVFERMETERQRIAKEIRSQGSEAAEKIRADAERQRTIIKAEAFRTAEQLRGEGDGKAAEIYANAYNQNKEFYSFYRSLTAYTNTFNSSSDVMIVEPDSDFFGYFKNADGAK